ncbi:CRISPR-associated protein Cmr2 [Laspinema sp. D1]|uniref:CRISPR-associated protein Cmr2 n=1 Tax=Laspinema palackyanum D2a TaxID=2953684 RepID=A0ABT2MUI9_9CYAN|nr:CRISPR-associated protein Cmr2 [Laspinema sp. D2a]
MYVFLTFAPIQGFIEKSRKLRDLYGASLILSYLSHALIEAAQKKGAIVISPGLPKIAQGMPNRILLQGNFSEEDAHQALVESWRKMLDHCRQLLVQQIKEFHRIKQQADFDYTWEREWDKWKTSTWELFWAEGETPKDAKQQLEQRKLARQWKAINWIGDSSSLSGSDAIAYPRLEAPDINLTRGFPQSETHYIEVFYDTLAEMFDNHQSQWKTETENSEIEGKFIDANERLSIPELVKRLVTHSEYANRIGIPHPKKFKDIVRKTPEKLYWTGWFMGDGDRMGDLLQKSLELGGDEGIGEFSRLVRQWGTDLYGLIPRELGRTIYAGGDDFFGIFYRGQAEQISGNSVLEQLKALHKSWQGLAATLTPLVQENATLSLGLVWVGGSVPQRDVLQHCRDTQERSKKRGRDRITLRVVFNNGQFVEWTSPWEYLPILTAYQDLDGGSNWSHVYRDLAQLKARYALGFGVNDLESLDSITILDFKEGALEFLDIYFSGWKEKINKNRHKLFEYASPEAQKNCELIHWIDNLIQVGWHLLS